MPPEFLPRSQATRRTFVQAAAALGPAAPFAPSMAAAEDTEDYWRAIKAMFPFREGIIPMNAANLCPSPRRVSDRVAELARDIASGIAHQNRAKFTKLAADARTKVALHIGVDADEVALVRNTSEGSRLINAGLPLEAGDEIVPRDQNHPANGVAWDVRAARFGYTLKRVSTPADPESPDRLRDVLLGAFTRWSRVVALTHVSSLTGVRLPVQEICQEARRRGICSHVDGAQTWGALRSNPRAIGCDSFSASAHTWPMGPKEAGPDREPGIGTGRRTEGGPSQIAGMTLMTPFSPGMSAGFAIVSVPPNAARRLYAGLYSKYGVATSSGTRLCAPGTMWRQRLRGEGAVASIAVLRLECANLKNS